MDSQSEYELPHWEDGAYDEGKNEEPEEELVHKYYDEDVNLTEPSLVDQPIDDSQSGYESSHGDDRVCGKKGGESDDGNNIKCGDVS